MEGVDARGEDMSNSASEGREGGREGGEGWEGGRGGGGGEGRLEAGLTCVGCTVCLCDLALLKVLMRPDQAVGRALEPS